MAMIRRKFLSLVLAVLLASPSSHAARLFTGGSTDKVNFSAPSAWTTDFSLSMWIKPTSMPTTGNYTGFFGYNFAASDTVRKPIMFLYNPSGTQRIYASVTKNGGSANDAYTDTVTLTTGTWQHLAVTIHVTDVSTPIVTRIYLNGTLGTTTGDGNGILSTGSAPDSGRIGGYVQGGADSPCVDAAVADVAMWFDVTVLNQSEINALVHGARPDRVRINPIRYYPLEGWQTTEPDYGSAHLGTTSITGTSRADGPPVLPR